MKKCIWCLKSSNETSFNKIAHTIPQSMGGLKVCDNVCDKCNSFFGSHSNGLPPIETVLKETFNITRARLLNATGHMGKNKTLPRFSSIYFNVNFGSYKMDLKAAYKYLPNFQEKIGRQLKKGIYKIFLEETERQNKNGHDSQFNFIREFCLNDQGDYPLFNFKRNAGIIMMSDKWAKNPELFFEKEKKFKYLMSTEHFFEFELLGHVLSIAVHRDWPNFLKDYVIKTSKAKETFFHSLTVVDRFDDIDLTLSILDDRKA